MLGHNNYPWNWPKQYSCLVILRPKVVRHLEIKCLVCWFGSLSTTFTIIVPTIFVTFHYSGLHVALLWELVSEIINVGSYNITYVLAYMFSSVCWPILKELLTGQLPTVYMQCALDYPVYGMSMYLSHVHAYSVCQQVKTELALY